MRFICDLNKYSATKYSLANYAYSFTNFALRLLHIPGKTINSSLSSSKLQNCRTAELLISLRFKIFPL
jgi:hypothetical protein